MWSNRKSLIFQERCIYCEHSLLTVAKKYTVWENVQLLDLNKKGPASLCCINWKIHHAKFYCVWLFTPLSRFLAIHTVNFLHKFRPCTASWLKNHFVCFQPIKTLALAFQLNENTLYPPPPRDKRAREGWGSLDPYHSASWTHPFCSSAGL